MDNAHFSILLNPAESRSGLTVNTTEGLNSVFLTNAYRRPGYCYIDRVSIFDHDGTERLSPEKLTDFEVKEVNGVSGAVSSLVDYVLGNYPYVYQSTKPINLPVPEGAIKARYRLCVVGPTIKEEPVVDEDWNGTKDYEKIKHDEITDEFMLMDYFLPLIVGVLLPTKMIDDYLLFYRTTDLFKNLSSNVTKEIPTALELAHKGQIKEAFYELFNAFVGNETFRRLILQSLIEGIQNAYGIAAAQEAAELAEKWVVVLDIVDRIMVVFDTSIMNGQLKNSHDADIWEITVTQPKVVLTQDTSELISGEEANFKVTVPELSGSKVNLVYTWKNTATCGQLTDGLPDHEDSFESSKNQATYTAGGKGEGKDTITVEVWALSGPSQSVREYVGEASGEINVQWRQGSINVSIYNPHFHYYYSVNLMEKNSAAYTVSQWTQENRINNFGSGQFSTGEYKIVVFAYDSNGKVTGQAACPFKLKAGQNDVYIEFGYNYIISAETILNTPWFIGDSWAVKHLGAGTSWYLNGKEFGDNFFDAKAGDSLRLELAFWNFDQTARVETFRINPFWLYSWFDGERYQLYGGGDFNQYFNNERTIIEKIDYTIPNLKTLLTLPRV